MRYSRLTLGELVTIKYGKNQKRVQSAGGTIPIYGTGGLMGYATEALYEKPSVLIGRKGTINPVRYVDHPFWTVDTLFYTEVNEAFVRPKYLYYLMSLLNLDSYNEGTTIPSLRTETLNRLEFDIPDLDYQEKVLSMIEPIDRRIKLNEKVNENLQAQAFTVFDRLISSSRGELVPLNTIAELNPKRQIAKGVSARYIDMSQLSTSGAFPSGWEMKPYNGGMRFSNGDTIMARITPCLENGKTAFIDFLDSSEVAFGSTEYIVLSSRGVYPSEFFYCLARYPSFVDYAVANMNGSSGRQRVSAETLSNYYVPLLNKDDLALFAETVPPLFSCMRNNSLENMRLASLRDILLPRLMSGELDVSSIEL